MSSPPFTQVYLGNVLHQLFPNYIIHTNTRKVLRTNTPVETQGHFLELDFYIPALSLGFEAQDPAHYSTTHHTYEPLELVQQHDDSKRQQFLSEGGTLVIVPYWWNGSPTSLVATIHQQRPEILLDFESTGPSGPNLGPNSGPSFADPETNSYDSDYVPIPLLPPEDAVVSAVDIPGVGGLIHATFDLQIVFTQFQWWLSEKYDGLRTCWNKRKLYNKYGTAIQVPSFFGFPAEFLDGEIWFGRGSTYDSNQMTVPGTTKPWTFLRYLVFDYPISHAELSLEERYQHLLYSVPSGHSFVQIIACRRCANQEDLRGAMDAIMGESGEGVVLRQPTSPYTNNRTVTFLKYKAQRDSEAVVMRDLGEGHYELKLASGQIFNSQLVAKYEGPKPKIGDVVTFSFLRIDRFGLPNNSQIFRVRKDMGWENVINNFRSESPRSQTVNTSTNRKLRPITTRHPRGYWTVGESKNIRNLLMDFAETKKFDYLDENSWYQFYHDIRCMKGGRVALDHYNGSVTRMLMDIFPQIPFELEKFPRVGMRYWDSWENRRKLLESVAKKHGFDPLVPESWYKFRSVDIINMVLVQKGGSAALKSYGRSATKLLMDLFPNINIDPAKFSTRYQGYWFVKSNVRKFLDELAEEQGFDPLVAENWYTVTAHDIFCKKSGSLVFELYGSLKGLIASNYPNVMFDLSKFGHRKDVTYNMAKQRQFFFDFAQKNNFDPLVPTNWYSRKRSILQVGDGFAILAQNRWSLGKALLCNLPEVDFDVSKFANSEAKKLQKTLVREWAAKIEAFEREKQEKKKIEKEKVRKRKRKK